MSNQRESEWFVTHVALDDQPVFRPENMKVEATNEEEGYIKDLLP